MSSIHSLTILTPRTKTNGVIEVAGDTGPMAGIRFKQVRMRK